MKSSTSAFGHRLQPVRVLRTRSAPDNRHTLVTELAEPGEGDEVIEHRRPRRARYALGYSHVRMEAKRRALDKITAHQRAATRSEKRKRRGSRPQSCPKPW